jgi:Tol biopolymer transport system component
MPLRACLAGLAGALAVAAPAAAIPLGSTALIDRPSGFGALPFDGAGSSLVDSHSMSGNGCFVVIESSADGLVQTDDNAAGNIFRVDRCTAGNPVVQVNTASNGTPSEAGSSAFAPSISTDGRYVAFMSGSSVLDAAATSANRTQAFVKDLQTGTLELASRGDGAGGAPIPDNAISRALISGNGQYVVFATSGALDADNADGVANQIDLYVRDLLAHRTHMLSVTSTGLAGHAVSQFSFDLDDTASRVVFTSSNKLTPGDTDNGTDAYVRQGIGGSGENTQLVSSSGGGQPANADFAFNVAISPDSVSVAYTTAQHVFRSQCVFTCATVTQLDAPRTGGTNTGSPQSPFFAPFSGASTTRLYWLTTSGLDPADTDGLKDLYARDIADANANTAIHLMSSGVSGEVQRADSTESGGVVVLNAGIGPHVLALSGGQVTAISHPPGEPARTDEAGSAFTRGARSISDDGRFVTFESGAPALGGSQNLQQILVRDVVSGDTTLVSVGSDGTSPADATSFLGEIDGAGDRVVFTSPAANLVPGVADGKTHVYMRDLAAGTTRLVDQSAGGTASSQGAFNPAISGDGRRVAFSSQSTDLPAAPGGTAPHVYVVDLVAGTTVLADQTDNGVVGDSQATNPELDRTGRRVSFNSLADNLGGGPNTFGAIYVRDIEASTTTWVSVPEDGNPAHEFPSDTSSISADGRRIAFGNSSPDFGYGAVNKSEVFVRDLDAGTTTLASRGQLGAANSGVNAASLSRDGTKVAFDTFASNLDGAHGPLEVYLRDLTAGTTSLVALRDGGGGPGRLGSTQPSLSADGACMAFSSFSDDLVTPSYGPDHFHVFLRALSAGCPVVAAEPPPGGGGGGEPPPGGGAPDPRPVVRGLRVTHKRFVVTRRRTASNARAKPKRGTAFVFRLSEKARTTITISRSRKGRRVKVGTLKRTKTKAGKNKVAFSGRIGKKALRPGVYRATVVATDRAKQRSKPRRVAFRVVKPKR